MTKDGHIFYNYTYNIHIITIYMLVILNIGVDKIVFSLTFHFQLNDSLDILLNMLTLRENCLIIYGQVLSEQSAREWFTTVYNCINVYALIIKGKISKLK